MEKYRVIKDLTLPNIIKEDPCPCELKKLVENYPNTCSYTLEQVITNRIWVNFLIQKGFIEEIKEKTISYGEIVKICSSDGTYGTYLIAKVGYKKIYLISEFGECYRHDYMVENPSEIPYSEIDNIVGRGSTWRKVKCFKA
jgi:hypothetical protein